MVLLASEESHIPLRGSIPIGVRALPAASSASLAIGCWLVRAGVLSFEPAMVSAYQETQARKSLNTLRCPVVQICTGCSFCSCSCT